MGILRVHEIGDLYSFDANVFLPNDKDNSDTADVCSFMLMLSLAYNDLKYLSQINVCINEDKPISPGKCNRHAGQYSGMTWYIRKLWFSILRELMENISKSEAILSHPLFEEVLRKLSKEAREKWNMFIDVSKNVQKNIPEYDKYKPLKELCERMRNHVASHYDLNHGNMINGYKNHFISQPKSRAYISRGDAMAERKPFFADCIVAGYFELLLKKIEDTDYQEFYKVLNHPLWEIIEAFIQVRGGSFRKEIDEI
ncbi:MAG: hypothetical protein LHV68_08640 [Elusimicrobia bacterium]|nr:hypothetical protein [Candidatus Liberimonas magnetica]